MSFPNINKISGWLILDKQSGITSRKAVTGISKVLKIKKVGHCGTLDPMATGVLPIAIGEATKIVSLVQNKKKKYSFTIKWGVSTDTDDIEGKILEKSSVRPTKKQIVDVLKRFTGKINQKPPYFSAIKIDGKRSYHLARKNIKIAHKSRPIQIYKLSLKKIVNPDLAEFEVICGKGTYIRSLARDIAEKLNTKGHIARLRRHFVGNFDEKDTIFIDFFKEIIHSPSFLKKIKPIESVLDDIPALLLNETEARKLRQGQKLKFDTLKFNDFFIFKYPNYQEFEKVYAISKNKLTAVVKIEDGLVKPKRIINYQTERKKDVD